MTAQVLDRTLFSFRIGAPNGAYAAEAGILGALTGVIGSLQAMEVIKEIVGVGIGLTGRLLLYDARAARFETIGYAWDPSNPLTGAAAAA